MSMPLEGIKIIDCTQVHMGPTATCMLSDLGADVIKIEPPVTGDMIRGVKVLWGIPVTLAGNRNCYTEALNRNKRSITLDLKKEKAREVVYRLVERADVFIHSFRKGVTTRLGIDYEILSQYNPRLIYANGSGYGYRGPDSGAPAVDTVTQARSGIMTMSGDTPTTLIGGPIDALTGIMLAYGVLAALIARDRLGVGQEIEVSLLGSALVIQNTRITTMLLTGEDLQLDDRAKARNPLFNNYRCKDNRWLQFGILQSDRHWPDFCDAVGIKELENDPRFKDAEQRQSNSEELVSILDAIFASKTSDEWSSILKAKKDLIFAQVRTLSEVVTDPQVLENEYITDFKHPVLGPVKFLGIPVNFAKTPGKIRTEAPELGQHTEEILLGLGYTWEEIGQLRDEEVI